jgi:DUF1680 family protein
VSELEQTRDDHQQESARAAAPPHVSSQFGDLRNFGVLPSLSILLVASMWVQPWGAACAEEPATLPHVLTAVPGSPVVIDDGFWAPKLKVWREVTIPDCFAKFERDGALANFDKVRDGTGGRHGGPPWYDGLIYEMICASADFLSCHSDPALETRLDAYVERIAAAASKDADGYLSTYTQLVEPTHRWGLGGGNDREQHDVYNAGALVEAAVHYYRATGKDRLLRVAVKLANHMADVMGPPPKKNVVPGHALSEAAMVELYGLFRHEPRLKARMPVPVDEGRYLKLAEFWIENRGHHAGRQSFGAYDQDDKPVLEQRSIEGHAVRATLLWAGVVATGIENGRGDYLAAARRVWENLVARRMYVTGGVGAVAAIEGFGRDYELPNNGYLETCAAVGAGFFHQNMAMAFADARYADELERVLYNGALSGVSLKGDRYFYDNPLVAVAGRTRWSWHACPCCPPMFLKMMGELPGDIYATDSDGVYINQFVGSRTTITAKSTKIAMRQATRYPWDGEIALEVDPDRPIELALYIRLPSWCAEPRISANSEALPAFERVRGYACLRRIWKPGDSVRVSLPMPVERVEASANVRANTGRAVIRRGPVIYCFEAEDNRGHVGDLVIPVGTQLTPEFRPDWLGGVTVARGKAAVLEPRRADVADRRVCDIDVTAIPYFANANRQLGAMMVWIAGSPDQARQSSLASRAKASASHCNPSDTLTALNGQVEEPAASDDSTIRRFTWWDHRGTKEWVQYDFTRAERISAVDVYRWDERRLKAHCRAPTSWRLLYRTVDGWAPVSGAGVYRTEIDRFNRVTFSAVETKSLRLEAQLQPGWSGGILEWRVE